MVGMELTIDPAPVIQAGYKQGLLLVSAGQTVIRFVPPLIATTADVDALVERLTLIFDSMGGGA